MRLLTIVLLCCSFNCLAQPKIDFGNTIVELGEVPEGPIYNITWYFHNTGNEPLVISDVKSSGSILLVSNYDKSPVRPGGQGCVQASLTTKGWANNRVNKSLVVKSNAREIILTAQGFVTTDSLDHKDRPDTFTNMVTNAVVKSNDVYYNIQPGDVLFQDLDCGAECDAIEKVTEGIDGMDFSHCGIVVQMGNEMMVVEAYGAVKATLVNDFLARTKDASGKPRVVIGRLKDEQSSLADESAEIAKKYIGKGYDDAFEMGNDKYYCSELVYECFKKANKNKPFFQLNKMTFKEPGTDTIMSFWVDYFKKLGKPVPEGKKGINPGAMSRNKDIQIIRLQQL
ncbi:YiiX/YebB-like N1pC/P60 family cysteine hydrolase [Polluticoccus soli]|uniref:YiiX/YebB-like N1pC/P60 family cysteine hydrolase n=1 Tax=Polluticoccus soli TaxID=3034150 RepID=UPI0023E1E0B9|nr:YiiX/YebB-like N1pC/P60 family cysteine hydrolase [Flavipsychrobacter sp. JY13-12]